MEGEGAFLQESMLWLGVSVLFLTVEDTVSLHT